MSKKHYVTQALSPEQNVFILLLHVYGAQKELHELRMKTHCTSGCSSQCKQKRQHISFPDQTVHTVRLNRPEFRKRPEHWLLRCFLMTEMQYVPLPTLEPDPESQYLFSVLTAGLMETLQQD